MDVTRVDIHVTRRLYIRMSQTVLVTPFITQEWLYRFQLYLGSLDSSQAPIKKIRSYEKISGEKTRSIKLELIFT